LTDDGISAIMGDNAGKQLNEEESFVHAQEKDSGGKADLSSGSLTHVTTGERRNM
jgi:hypothetical protein